MMRQDMRRNTGIDVLKGLACIAVVFMHCEFPGMFGVMLQCLTRWSVPLFFAVSGFYFRGETAAEGLRKAKRIALITLGASAFYILAEIVLHRLGGDLAAYARSEFGWFNLLSFVVFNSPVFVSGHLWFLFALIYVYLAAALLVRLKLFRHAEVIGAALLICHFLLAYGFFLMGKSLPGGAYRNFLFEGLPFFLMGNLFSRRQPRCGLKTGMLLIAAGLIASAAERLWLGRDFSVHMGSVAVLAGMLMLANDSSTGIRWPRLLETPGRKYSLYIYIFHPAVYRFMDCILDKRGGMPEIWLWIRPVCTLALSAGLAMLIYSVKHAEKER